MSKVQIKSIFEQIASEVFNMKDVNKAKQFVTEFVNNKKIKDEDKKVIVDNVNACKSISRIQSYICNSLLRYEGMSVNK
jgi:F0F1-type ATP synthase delta subunit